MRRLRLPAVLAGGFILFSATVGFAELLGVIPEFPGLTFNATGTTEFDAVAQHFSVGATPLAIRFSPTEPPRLVQAIDGIRVLTLDVFINANGLLLGGHEDEDLLIIGQVDSTGDGEIDFAGVLVTGEVAAFGWENVGGTDLFDFRFTLTGGELSPLFNGMDIGLLLTVENSTFNGDFSTNFWGGAKGVLGPIPLLQGFSGCTPGFWKQPRRAGAWPAPYSPDTLFKSVFQRDVPGDPTLAEALRLRGGHLNALMRHATAALLNAAHSGINPDKAFDTPMEVINAFRQAFDSGDFETTKNLLEASNEHGCPL